MTPSLFLPRAQWSAILRLDSDTAKGRVFLALRSGGWILGKRLADVGGFDYRSRCARLRDLGVPVESRPCDYSALYEYRIPHYFVDEYEQHRRKIA